MKNNKPLFILIFIIFLFTLFSSPEKMFSTEAVPDPSDGPRGGPEYPNPIPGGGGQTQQGTLSFSPSSVEDGGTFSISLSEGPANANTILWVNNNNTGFKNFGSFLQTNASGAISAIRTLNCSQYQTLEPGQTVAVSQTLNQSIYLEYAGLDRKSSTATHTKDCADPAETTEGPATPNPGTNPTPSTGTGTDLFPITVRRASGIDYVDSPFPSSKLEATSTCSKPLCKDSNDIPLGTLSAPEQLPMVQYYSPIKDFVGRFFDGGGYIHGGSWKPLQGPDGIKISTNKNRIYVRHGTTIAAYTLNSFFTRIQTNPLYYFFQKISGEYLEAAIPWDAYFYVEKDNGWLITAVDAPVAIDDFDIDDRGYVYIASDHYGWGMARDNGQKIVPVMQMVGHDSIQESGSPVLKPSKNGTNKLYLDGIAVAQLIFSFKSGSNYYALIENEGWKLIYDVTDPLNPRFVTDDRGTKASDSIFSIAKLSRPTGDVVAIVTADGKLKIYNASDLVSGFMPAKTFQAGTSSKDDYAGLAADPVSGRFFSVVNKYTSNQARASFISVFAPNASESSAGDYEETRHAISFSDKFKSELDRYSLSYDNGFLVSNGNRTNGTDIKIWVFRDNKPVELNTSSYFHEHYSQAPAGFATAAAPYNALGEALVKNYGGKDYLFVSTGGQGDVYEIEPVVRDLPVVTTPPTPTTTPPINIPPVQPIDPAIFTTPCEETYAGKPALILFCNQLNYVQSRSCDLVPGLPFCRQNLVELP